MTATRFSHPDVSFRRSGFRLIFAGFLTGILSSAAIARKEPAPLPPPPYALVADQATQANAIARVRVRSVAQLAPERAPGLRAGEARYYVEADSSSLIRGSTGLAQRISFLVDGSPDKKARPVVKGQEYLIFGSVGERVDQFRLLSAKSVIPWSDASEALTRKIVGEIIAPNAPPAISRIESAFHVVGNVTGESESQIFLQTQDKRPISLSIIRRPDETPSYTVSIGEVVGEDGRLPPKDTLLWYRLACHLPADLPQQALSGVEPNDAQAARRDYREMMAALGPCSR